MDILIEGCDGISYFPYHVFYNGWGPRRFSPTGRRRDRDALRKNPYWPHKPQQDHWITAPLTPPGISAAKLAGDTPHWWGCAALSSHRVVKLLAAKKEPCYAPKYLRYAMPWSKLLTPDSATYPEPETFLDTIQYRLAEDTRSAAAPVEDNFPLDMAVLRDLRIYQPPLYVSALLATTLEEPNQDDYLYRLQTFQGTRTFAEPVSAHRMPPQYITVMDLSRLGAGSNDTAPRRFNR